MKSWKLYDFQDHNLSESYVATVCNEVDIPANFLL